ncbi:uncharacterized protein LOC143239756 isoform X3 [Tachypleus tridentatus]
MSLSKRVQNILSKQDHLTSCAELINSDLYDVRENPQGYISFQNVFNELCVDVLVEKLNEAGGLKFDATVGKCYEFSGIPRLRSAMANFMNHFFDPVENVNFKDLYFYPGITGCFSLLGHCLAESGDVILSPTPVCGQIPLGFGQLSSVDIWPIPLTSSIKPGEHHPFQLTLQKIEAKYQRAVEAGKNVKGIILLNPHNPLGQVYSPELVSDILHFCYRKKIHIIVDETYTFSVFDENVKFQSVLSLPIPDPERTHILFSLTKVLGIESCRVGIIHTCNRLLQRCLEELAMFSSIPSPIMSKSAYLLEDLEWCKKFFKLSCSQLAKMFHYCKKRLEKMGLSVHDSVAGFFLWVDFRQYCEPLTFDGERLMFEKILHGAKLYITPGESFHCSEPGWFCIIFSINPKLMEEALDRLDAFLNDFHRRSQGNETSSTILCEGNKGIEYDQQTSQSSLEELVSLLKRQIDTSDWLTHNTADHWRADNPDAAEAFEKEQRKHEIKRLK